MCINMIVGFRLNVEINGAKNKLEQCYHYFTFLVKQREREREKFSINSIKYVFLIDSNLQIFVNVFTCGEIKFSES